MIYSPDRWVMVEITELNDDEDKPLYLALRKPIYKVFACWSGGYVGSDSWRMNSSVVKVEEFETHYDFSGYSGSVYECGKKSYGLNAYGEGILYEMMLRSAKTHKMQIMPSDTNWLELNWG